MSKSFSRSMFANEADLYKAEPEIIDSSSSYRQGYARCSRDNEQALEQLKQEYRDE